MVCGGLDFVCVHVTNILSVVTLFSGLIDSCYYQSQHQQVESFSIWTVCNCTSCHLASTDMRILLSEVFFIVGTVIMFLSNMWMYCCVAISKIRHSVRGHAVSATKITASSTCYVISLALDAYEPVLPPRGTHELTWSYWTDTLATAAAVIASVSSMYRLQTVREQKRQRKGYWNMDEEGDDGAGEEGAEGGGEEGIDEEVGEGGGEGSVKGAGDHADGVKEK